MQNIQKLRRAGYYLCIDAGKLDFLNNNFWEISKRNLNHSSLNSTFSGILWEKQGVLRGNASI